MTRFGPKVGQIGPIWDKSGDCFRNFPGAKINFVPKGIQVRFEMAVKQVYKQTERQLDIFVIIIVEFKSRSLNLASDKL